MDSDKCPDCGGDVRIGDWPLCNGDPAKHVPAGQFGEDPLEPYNDWQLDPYSHEGPEITTRAQRRKIMAKHSLEYVEPSKLKQPAGKRLYFDMKGR
jgi:hypothetical protein